MTGLEINRVLLEAGRDLRSVLPHLAALRDQPFVFEVRFGLA